jgi:hypothetical protein
MGRKLKNFGILGDNQKNNDETQKKVFEERQLEQEKKKIKSLNEIVEDVKENFENLLETCAESMNQVMIADRANFAKPSSDATKKKLTDSEEVKITLKPLFQGTSDIVEKKIKNYANLLKKTSTQKSFSNLVYDTDFFNKLERSFLTPLLFFFPTNIRISKIECEFFENEGDSINTEKINQKSLSSVSKITHRYASNNKGASNLTYYFKNGFLLFKIKTKGGLEKQFSIPSPAISEDILKNIPKTADIIVVQEQYSENKTEFLTKMVKHNDFYLSPYYQIEKFYYSVEEENSIFADKFIKKNKRAGFEKVNMLKNEQKATLRALRNLDDSLSGALDGSDDEGEGENNSEKNS